MVQPSGRISNSPVFRKKGGHLGNLILMQSVRHNQGFRQVVSQSSDQVDCVDVYASQRQTGRAVRLVGSAVV